MVDWMDRLQSSTQPPGQASAARMEIIRDMHRSGEVSSMSGASAGAGAGVRSSVSHTMGDPDEAVEDAEEETTEEEDADKARSALPDITVPIGLLANLSLDKEDEKDKGRGKSKARTGSGTGPSGAAVKPEEDDNNVVCGDFCARSRWHFADVYISRVSRTRSISGQVCRPSPFGLGSLLSPRTRSRKRPQYSKALDRKEQSP